MLKRLSYAFLGASAITLVLILGMSQIAQFLERPDSQLYMRVMDFIPGSGARRLPDKRMPQAQPERAAVEAADVAVEGISNYEPAAGFTRDVPEIAVTVDLDLPAED
jgi:hypothetical protein